MNIGEQGPPGFKAADTTAEFIVLGEGDKGGAVAEEFFRDGLCLPSGSNLSEDDLTRVVEVIQRMHTG